MHQQPIFLKVDQCQPLENFWTYFQIVNYLKTKPRLDGNQIPFGGKRLVPSPSAFSKFGLSILNSFKHAQFFTYTQNHFGILKS